MGGPARSGAGAPERPTLGHRPGETAVEFLPARPTTGNVPGPGTSTNAEAASEGAEVQHHDDGSATLNPEEMQDLQQLFAAILAGNRIESGFTAVSKERERIFRRLYTALNSR